MDSLDKKFKSDEIANLNQENEIIRSRTIDKDRLNILIDWFEYGAASTFNFLIGRLRLIKSIIDTGNPVKIYEDPVLILSTQEDLKNWIKSRFDESLIEDVFEV
ncbi:MAG TPA: hypothetical protein VF677_12165 [Flavobacterium sp.]|jgi:DNA repair photolyase